MRPPRRLVWLLAGSPISRSHYRLSIADILEAHERALEFGGAVGIISLSALQSAIGRPYSGYHRSIHAKLAALTESLCNNHGFVDGNKRTTLYAIDILIKRSGYRFIPLRHDELNTALEEMILAVARGRMDREQLLVWFKRMVVRRTSGSWE